MKKPLLLVGLLALAVVALAESLGMQATASNPARLECNQDCGKTYH